MAFGQELKHSPDGYGEGRNGSSKNQNAPLLQPLSQLGILFRRKLQPDATTTFANLFLKLLPA